MFRFLIDLFIVCIILLYFRLGMLGVVCIIYTASPCTTMNNRVYCIVICTRPTHAIQHGLSASVLRFNRRSTIVRRHVGPEKPK